MTIENIFTSALIIVLPFAAVYFFHLAFTNSERSYAVAEWVGENVCMLKLGIVLFIVTSLVEYIGWGSAATLMFIASCGIGVLWIIFMSKLDRQAQ